MLALTGGKPLLQGLLGPIEGAFVVQSQATDQCALGRQLQQQDDAVGGWRRRWSWRELQR